LTDIQQKTSSAFLYSVCLRNRVRQSSLNSIGRPTSTSKVKANSYFRWCWHGGKLFATLCQIGIVTKGVPGGAKGAEFPLARSKLRKKISSFIF